MAITDYASLQTAVANYLHRGDLTSTIPDFISLAETKLNRRLRLRAMENLQTGTVAQTIALPTGFLEMKSMTITSGGTTFPIGYITPNEVTSDTGIAQSYSLIGDNIYFVPIGSGESYTMVYYKKLDSVADGANWLITNAPDVYLYASLLEATPYIENDKRIQVWTMMLEQSIAQLNTQDKGDRYGPSLMVRVA